VAAPAKLAGLTKPELQTAFKSVYGKTVMLHVREARLQYAHALNYLPARFISVNSFVTVFEIMATTSTSDDAILGIRYSTDGPIN